MSLRSRLLILMGILMFMTASVLTWREIDGTRRSVREEIEAASRVAIQILRVVDQRPFEDNALLLKSLGRVRATELTLFSQKGEVVYTSPPSHYKEGRNAPAWFADMVTPPVQTRDIALQGGRLSVRPDPSRSVVDGWDDFVTLMLYTVPVMALVAGLTVLTLLHTLSPLARIEAALRSLQRGDFETRLPPLPGREAALMSQAFNDMAQAIQDNIHARDEARAAQASLAQNRELTQVILQRVEAERARIARDLHDELGQQLTAVRTVAQVLSQDSQLIQHKGQLVDLLKRSTDNMAANLQNMLPRLRPLALDRLGLNDALSDQMLDWRRIAPHTHFTLETCDLPPDLGDTLATAVYRITQEAVTNAIRHAQPSRIHIQLHRTDTELAVTVSDDGPGLPQAWNRPGHHGLLGIRERAHALGGTIAFQNGLGTSPEHPGLSLVATLPWVSPGS